MTIATFVTLFIWLGIVLALVLVILAMIGVVPFDGFQQQKCEAAARYTPYSRGLRAIQKRRREYGNSNLGKPTAAASGAIPSPRDAEV